MPAAATVSAEAAGRVPPGRGGPSHQLTIAATRDLRAIAVSCTCLQTVGRDPIGVRPKWAGGEAYEAWLGHLEAAADHEAAI